MDERTAQQDAALSAALDRAIARWKVDDEPVTVLFSGGVDSGLLGWELREGAQVAGFTIGRPGAADLAEAERSARSVGLRWNGRTVDDDAILSVYDRLGPEVIGASPTMRSVFLALGVALSLAPTRTVLCGQGADELFFGYAHYRRGEGDDAPKRASEDLERLRTVDWPRTERIARLWDRRVHAPYLSPEFVAASLAIPAEERLTGSEPKARFRRWAERRGLPSDIAHRPKRAVQFGSGIDRWLRRRPLGAAVR